jgi:alpha-L-fucosidase
MNSKLRNLLVAVLMPVLLAVAPPRSALTAPAGVDETPAQHDARMQWWRDARFGMFIHWGLYAIPAGHWDGKEIDGIGEWIMDKANIPAADYEQLAKEFNPTDYDPVKWVRIAKQAGMKYLVITSKHHDGFCLFDTKTTDYDVVDATPYGKDLLKPLAEQCRKQGLRFCVYYSIMDWHHPAQYRNSPQHYNPTKVRPERKAEYLTYMKQQLKDLIDSCAPAVLWFDGEWPTWYTADDGLELYAYLRHLKPDLIINNRVGSGRQGMAGLSKKDRKYAGDFGTPEQEIPDTGLPGVDWESCMTMNDTWGFKRDDHHWKTAATLIRNLVDITSKGGNYLLNVGPTASGEIPQPSVERLHAIGQWMQLNGVSIYATQPSPLGRLPWGRSTQKSIDGRVMLYLQVFDWPADGKLALPRPKGSIVQAYLLADPAKTPRATHATDAGLVIDLPTSAPDPVCSVVALEIRTHDALGAGLPTASQHRATALGEEQP